ncbi:MAG: SDR family NAD(P)-dependent oxidoreductase [Patescibacteria group bacterium]|nr:SDR family NAD(P)-dependent oxidoreductase [Patescibacteria group bacterium]MDD4611354.1 SDR family NAD(P)-dependent oxidoreductase [Patescibacteria group bacterium]
MKKNILIIGGTSGLGLELAKIYSSLGDNVFITGRKNPGITQLQYLNFSITDDIKNAIKQIDDLFLHTGEIDTLIYSAGFCQEGHINDFDDKEIIKMINVGLSVPALIAKRLKNNHGKLSDIIFTLLVPNIRRVNWNRSMPRLKPGWEC